MAAGVGGVALNVIARNAPWRRHPWNLAGLAAGLVGTELPVPSADGIEALGRGYAEVGVRATIAPLMPYHSRRRPITSNAPVPV